MPKSKSSIPWSVADAMFVEVEIAHPRERQMHLVFDHGPRLVISHPEQVPLAAELIIHLRQAERAQKGGQP